ASIWDLVCSWAPTGAGAVVSTWEQIPDESVRVPTSRRARDRQWYRHVTHLNDISRSGNFSRGLSSAENSRGPCRLPSKARPRRYRQWATGIYTLCPILMYFGTTEAQLLAALARSRSSSAF